MIETTNSICNNCAHCEVCKYKNEFAKSFDFLNNEWNAKDITDPFSTPFSEKLSPLIKVSVECRQYKERAPKSASFGPLSNSTDSWYYDSLNKVVKAQKEYNKKYNNESRNFKFFI